RNFQAGQFEGAEALSGESLNGSLRLARRSCAACTIGCEHIYASGGGEVRLEYETLFALGPLCGISGREAVLRAAKRCDALAVETEDRAALMDSLILCKFLRGVFADLWEESAALLRPVTGWEVMGDELRLLAKRVVTAKKLYNQREGWTAAEDTLPKRFLS